MQISTEVQAARGVEVTDAMRASAREIGEGMIARHKGEITVDDLRAIMRASRDLHGDAVHEIVKARAIAGIQA